MGEHDEKMKKMIADKAAAEKKAAYEKAVAEKKRHEAEADKKKAYDDKAATEKKTAGLHAPKDTKEKYDDKKATHYANEKKTFDAKKTHDDKRKLVGDHLNRILRSVMKPATGSRPATLTHVKKDEDREKKEATPMCMGFIPTKEDVVGPCGKWAKGSIMFEQKVGTMSIKMCIYFKKSDAKCPPGGKVGDKPDDNKNMCTLLLTPTKK